jgi:hypothetical protein
MNDSDDEHTHSAAPAGDDAPQPQRKPRGGGRGAKATAGGETAADPAVGGEAGAGEGAAANGDGTPARRRRARRAVTEVENAGEFVCSECQRGFAAMQGLLRHMQAKHTESPATAAMVEANATPGASGPRRRGGGRNPSAAGADTTENGNDPAAPGGARAPRKRRPRKPRGSQLDPDGRDSEVTASAAAAAALGGSPAPSESKPERLVTLLRCKLCEIGFK